MKEPTEGVKIWGAINTKKYFRGTGFAINSAKMGGEGDN